MLDEDALKLEWADLVVGGFEHVVSPSDIGDVAVSVTGGETGCVRGAGVEGGVEEHSDVCALSASTARTTTHAAAARISLKRGFSEWHDPRFQMKIVERMRQRARAAGRRLDAGVPAFGWLAEVNP